MLGRNGAGKSSTLKAVMNLVNITGGEIGLDNRDLRGLPTTRSAAWAWAGAREAAQFSDLTVDDNLLVGAKGDDRGRARVHRLFPKLAELARRRAGAYPGASSRCSRWREP